MKKEDLADERLELTKRANSSKAIAEWWNRAKGSDFLVGFLIGAILFGIISAILLAIFFAFV